MKRIYEKPFIEIETYEMDGSIAAGCRITVKMGPEHDGQPACEDFEAYEQHRPVTMSNYPQNVDFWDEENCLCYYNAGGLGTYFTS